MQHDTLQNIRSGPEKTPSAKGVPSDNEMWRDRFCEDNKIYHNHVPDHIISVKKS